MKYIIIKVLIAAFINVEFYSILNESLLAVSEWAAEFKRGPIHIFEI